MTDLDELKTVIIDTTCDQDKTWSARDEVEAYAKLWPFVFLVTDWNVWNESTRALRLEVIRWLERNEASYKFYQPRNGWGLVGFKDLKTATPFKLRWSGQGHVMSASAQDWNPHPLKSTYEATGSDEAQPGSIITGRPYDRYNRARDCGSRSSRNDRM
jgi:hypothetical protein